MELMVPQLFMAWGPVLLLSMEYINLGGWVGAIEAGGSSGPDLLVLVFINCIAILCQYLAACVGIVTRKNLAQICSEEYCRMTCVLLGVVVKLSMVASDLTMILSVARGINLFFGLDLLKCVIFAATVVILFPFFIALLDSSKLEVLFSGMSGFTLLFYVLGILVSQPEVQGATYCKYHGLTVETACSIMALFGASIKPHNLYSHSSIMQRRLPSKTIGGLIHDQFFSILYASVGMTLVSYVLMSSAAGMVDDVGLLMPTYQDALLLMDQLYMSPAAPFPFFLMFLLSSLIASSTQNLSGQVVSLNFSSTGLPIWVHDMIIKALAVVPALYCIQRAGPEGLYQLLLFSQVALAVLLPSSVIPLFRVSSTKSIMGIFRISRCLEIFALFAFLAMLISNVTFAIWLFGNSSWVINACKNVGCSVTLPYIILIIFVSISLGFMLHLAVTPLKSLNGGLDAEICTWELQSNHPELSEDREENGLDINILDEDEETVFELAPENLMEEIQCDNPTANSSLNLPEKIIDSDTDAHSVSPDLTSTLLSEAVQLEEAVHSQIAEPVIEMELVDVVDEASAVSLLAGVVHPNEDETDVHPNEDDEQNSASHILESSSIPTSSSSHPVECSSTPICIQPVCSSSIPTYGVSLGSVTTTSSTSQHVQPPSTANFGVPDSSENFRRVRDKTSNGSAKVVMGRAGRRRLADILDEFWGHLFDHHGQLTDEAKFIRADLLFGLDLEITMSLKADIEEKGSSINGLEEPEIMLALPTHLSVYGSSLQQDDPSEDTSYMVRKGNQSSSPGMQCMDGYSMRNGSEFYDRGIHEGGGHNRIDETVSSSGYIYNNSHSVSEHVNGAHYSWNDSGGHDPPMDRIYSYLFSSDGVHLDSSQSKHKRVALPRSVGLNTDPLWARHPCEQHFTMAVRATYGEDKGEADILLAQKKFLSYGESERIIIKYLRSCLTKLLRLEGSVWLFTQSGGWDEELINCVAVAEEQINEENANEVYQSEGSMETERTSAAAFMHGCGDGCVWQAELVVSFGVWCIHRILELLVMETRPELWGKYTYVLNRLQGIIDPAFFKQRNSLIQCECLEIQENHRPVLQDNNGNTMRSQFTTTTQMLDVVKEVEARLSARRGRSGTAVGDIAFPKGKENLASVLKRYKRRLAKKSIY